MSRIKLLCVIHCSAQRIESLVHLGSNVAGVNTRRRAAKHKGAPSANVFKNISVRLIIARIKRTIGLSL